MEKGTIINDCDLQENGWSFVGFNEKSQIWKKDCQKLIWCPETQTVLDIY